MDGGGKFVNNYGNKTRKQAFMSLKTEATLVVVLGIFKEVYVEATKRSFSRLFSGTGAERSPPWEITDHFSERYHKSLDQNSKSK